MSHGPPDLPIHLVPPLGGLLFTRGGHGKGLQPCFTIRDNHTDRSGAPATHIIYLPRWCHDPPDARVVAYFITLSSWSPPYARPRWCCGISHRNVSSLCLHSAALITAKTTAGATVGILDVDAILPGGLRYTFDDGGCDHRPDPLALRPCRADLSWRSSSPAGEQSSSSCRRLRRGLWSCGDTTSMWAGPNRLGRAYSIRGGA